MMDGSFGGWKGLGIVVASVGCGLGGWVAGWSLI